MCSACLLGKYVCECKDANCPWHCLVVAEVLQTCVGSQAIKCQKPTHKNESISTSTSHGKYLSFDCALLEQTVGNLLVWHGWWVLSPAYNVQVTMWILTDNTSFTNSRTTTLGVAISKYYAFECACGSQERLFLVSCQSQKWKCTWSSDMAESGWRWSVCHHPILFLCPMTQNHVALVGWITTKEIHLA